MHKKQTYHGLYHLIIRIELLQKNVGLMRLVYACQYSWQGLKAALSNEAVSRQEFFGFVFLKLITSLLNVSALEQIAMIISLILVLIIEIINCAVECVVDRLSTERHTLSDRA